jgi:hypothetical protein
MKKNKKKMKIAKVLFFSLYLLCTNIFGLQDAKDCKIIASNNGQYVYSLWIQNDSLNDVVQFAYSYNYASTWSVPTELSSGSQDAKSAGFISTNAYSTIYTIWSRFNGANYIIQFRRSLNYGQNWQNTMDLSAPNQDAKDSCIATNSNGTNIYAAWSRSNGTNDIIQFTKSNNSGSSFASVVDLSSTGQDASTPQIATNSTDSSLGIVWIRYNGTKNVVQFGHSANNGDTWDNIRDLSNGNNNSKEPKIIIIDNYIYVSWIETINSIDTMMFTKSEDNGTTFSDPYNIDWFYSSYDLNFCSNSDGQYLYASTYTSNGKYNTIHVMSCYNYNWIINDIPKYGNDSINPDICTSADGQYIYVTWLRFNKTNYIAQLSYSNNFSYSWLNSPIDLSIAGQDAKTPKIAISQDAQYVYVVWTRSDGTKDVVRTTFSNNYGASFSIPVTISN